MKNLGLKADKILLPKNVDMTAYSCIACDQFTSEMEYWKKLEDLVKDKPSTLHLVLPEIYLENNEEERIKKINLTMKEYLSCGLLKELKEGFILTVRSTPYVKRRLGLIGALDLEEYDFKKKSSSLIRATEGTIEERIPPRLKIRKDADLEFPHVMVLFDDEKKEITEELYKRRDKYKKVYDFDLNMGGGHITGYYIDDYKPVLEKFNNLLDSERLIKKYGKNDKFLFAVGDGNHSLATAKTHWDNLKESLSKEERINHPARFALCELNNIYDEGIYFEPIYRYVYNINVKDFYCGLKNIDGGKMQVYLDKNMFVFNGKNSLPEGISAVDNYIKGYITANGGNVDYVHGESNVKELVDNNKNSIGILFNKLDKADLFKYVSNNGAFPRKTFSMGEGIEKRYYLEGRRIKND